MMSLPNKMPLDAMSWRGIQKVAKAGKASEYWKVGDAKEIILNGKVSRTKFQSLQMEAFILGFDHNPDREGKNRIHFGIGMKKGKLVVLHGDKDFPMNKTRTNLGGWEQSYMRKSILGADRPPLDPADGTLLAALPRALREVMAPTTKYTDNEGNKIINFGISYHVSATRDALWLLSEYEIYGTQGLANPTEKDMQQQYDFFKTLDADTKFMIPSETNAYVPYWCRSPNGCDAFCVAYTLGNAADVATSNYALLPCFAV